MDPSGGVAAPTRWARDERTLWRRAAGGAEAVVLLPPGAESAFVLHGTGAHLWDLLAAPVTTADLGVALGRRFGASAAIATRDVEPIVAELAGLGALRPAE